MASLKFLFMRVIQQLFLSYRCAMCKTDKPRPGVQGGGGGRSCGSGSSGGRGESCRLGGRRATAAAVAAAPTPNASEAPLQQVGQVLAAADSSGGGDGGLMRTTPITRNEALHEVETKGLTTVKVTAEGTAGSSKRRKIQREQLRQLPPQQHLLSDIAEMPPQPHP
ncbi:hypothetical protein Vafri_1815, partial [Volvox africanus]